MVGQIDNVTSSKCWMDAMCLFDSGVSSFSRNKCKKR